jgi:hypothetical protein
LKLIRISQSILGIVKKIPTAMAMAVGSVVPG